MSKRTTTTHTVDMAQVADLNLRLKDHPGSGGTASDLGLEGVTMSGGTTLPGSAVLVRLAWDGAPEFPDIHGHFSTGGGTDGALVVRLHTQALRKLSSRLHAHHIWGQGSIPDARRR